jgi:hypothetical protein
MVMYYQEARYGVSLKLSKTMLADFAAVANQVNEAVENYGTTGLPVLKRLVSLTESLIKSYIRKIIDHPVEGVIQRLEVLSEVLRDASTSLIDKFVRVTVEKKTIPPKKRKDAPEVKEIKHFLRPALISGGPLSIPEINLAKAVNTDINQAVPRVVSTIRNDANFLRVSEKINSILCWLYQRTDAVNRLVKQRRNQIRKSIYESRRETAEDSKESPAILGQISALEWETEQTNYLSWLQSQDESVNMVYHTQVALMYQCDATVESLRTAIRNKFLERSLFDLLVVE